MDFFAKKVNGRVSSELSELCETMVFYTVCFRLWTALSPWEYVLYAIHWYVTDNGQTLAFHL